MAGNEWYETHKKNVAAALKKAKGAGKEDAVPCALVKLKDGSHLLCAGIAKNKMVMDAKKTGAKVVSEGTVFNDGDNPTFEVVEGDASVRTKFAAAAAEVLGSPMMVTVVKAPEPPKPDESTTPPPQPDPAKDEDGGFAARLKALLPNLQKAMADPKTGQDVKLKVSEATLFARKTDFAKANALLTDAEKLAQKAGRPGGSAPRVPPPPPPPPRKNDEGSFTARLKALMPSLQKAMADPKTGQDVKLKVSEANLLARKKDFAKANELLTEAEKLTQAPGTGPAPGGKPEPQEKGSDETGEQVETETEDTDTSPEEEDQVEPEDVESAEQEMEIDDSGEDESDESEDSGSEESEQPSEKPINLEKLSVEQLKAAMIDLRIVAKKVAGKLPKKAVAELGEIKQLEIVGSNLVTAVKDLISKLKKGKMDKASKYAARAQQAFGTLEGLASALDTSMSTNAYEPGKKGPEIKKDYKKAMMWYSTGGGRGGLLACLGKVKTSLQLEGG